MTVSSLEIDEAIGSATQPSATSVSACESVDEAKGCNVEFKTLSNPHAGHHKDLHKLSVINCHTMTEIIPNGEPVFIDNDCFSGYLQMLVRTPDVDCKKEEPPTLHSARRTSNYLRMFKRRFEFQFQIKLKKVPDGPIFLGCEVEDMIKLSRFAKGLSSVLLKMCRRINPGFHHSWGFERENCTPEEIDRGNYEAPHVSFPVEASFDRIVITKPGETPPKLGFPLHESIASVKRRKKMGSGSVDWNVEDTYTLSVWSAYFDWIQWKSMNVPAVRPFPLSAFTGEQPVYLSFYEILNMTPEEYKIRNKKRSPLTHKKSDLKLYAKFQFSHKEMTARSLNPRLEKNN